MSRYRVGWRHVVGVLSAVGTCLAFLAIDRGVLVFTSVLLLIVVGSTAWAVAELRGWREATWIGILTIWTVVSVIGYLAALGWAGVVLLTLVGLSSPPVVGACRRRWTGSGVDVVDDWPVVPTARASRAEVSTALVWSAEQDLAREGWMRSPSQQMQAATLCRAWRKSYLALGRPLSATTKAGVVQRRREILDELERRHPAGFSAWLTSGAEAAEDPSRYFVSQRGDESHR